VGSCDLWLDTGIFIGLSSSQRRVKARLVHKHELKEKIDFRDRKFNHFFIMRPPSFGGKYLGGVGSGYGRKGGRGGRGLEKKILLCISVYVSY